ncbi:MAG: sugar phosphate isomerase/epimerase [Clostridiales bacterium]|nr:sugar phosphate isomerase/epimerase [Clostridiales bacterium]
MKIGISTSTFFNTVAPEGVFDVLANMRADTTEVCLYTFSDYEKQYVENLASLKRNINVVAVSPMSTQFEPQLFSQNVRVRADAEAIFKKVCYACFAFGAKYYTFRGPINLGGEKNIDPSRYAQRLSQLADIAANYGVSLAVKNVHWSYFPTPDVIKKVLGLCPKLYFALDVYNAEAAGYDFREYLDVCAPNRISHITVTDVVKGVWGLPGNGKFNYDKMFSDLDRRKVTSPILVAVRSDKYSDFLQVRDSYEWLLELYKKFANK